MSPTSKKGSFMNVEIAQRLATMRREQGYSQEELAELLSEPLYHISNDYFLSYYLQWPLLNGAPGENPFLPHYRLWCMGLFARFPARDRVVLLR